MPGEGKLTGEQIRKARQWLVSKCPEFKCPLCGSKAVEVHERVVELRTFNLGKLVIGGDVFPNILVICEQCGCSTLINAIMAGVIDPSSEKTPSEPENHNAK